MDLENRINKFVDILYKEDIKTSYLDKISEILRNNTITYKNLTKNIKKINAKVKLSNLIYSGIIPEKLEFRDYLYDKNENPILIFLGKDENNYHFLTTEYLNENEISVFNINKNKNVKFKLDKNKIIIFEDKIINYELISEDYLNKELFIEEYKKFGLIVEYDYEKEIFEEIYNEKIKDEYEKRNYLKMYFCNLASYLFNNGEYELGKECMRIINKL